MSSILHNAPDVTTFAANVVVFLAAVAAAVAGAMHAVKKIKESWIDATKTTAPVVEKTQIIGGLLQDALGSAMVTEQLRAAVKSMDDLRDAVIDLRTELRENRATNEKMIDRMDRR